MYAGCSKSPIMIALEEIVVCGFNNCFNNCLDIYTMLAVNDVHIYNLSCNVYSLYTVKLSNVNDVLDNRTDVRWEKS